MVYEECLLRRYVCNAKQNLRNDWIPHVSSGEISNQEIENVYIGRKKRIFRCDAIKIM